jgi:adenine deaminase
MKQTIKANVVQIKIRKIFAAEIEIEDGKISHIKPINEVCELYALPGFIDSHVHIESSMLVPSEFARLAVKHGTVATVSDPHEIANVLGVKGIEFMINNAQKVNFHFYFGVPSCVPATAFETAGATINVQETAYLFEKYDLHYLAEMMNYPGVLFADKQVMDKISVAKQFGKVIDGHAPALRGEQAKSYIAAGISTDHECFTAEEAAEKLQFGMKILIREGSAAKNFEALIPLLSENYENMMFCSDDKHPDNLIESHIDDLVRRAVKKDIDVFKVLQVACLNPIAHYSLKVGKLEVGDSADFILVDNLKDFNVAKTYIKGKLVAENKSSFIEPVDFEIINYFDTNFKTSNDFAVACPEGKTKLNVIEAIDGELITKSYISAIKMQKMESGNFVMADVANDILKMCVVNRYAPNIKPAVAFIKNFGLKSGAIASSVGHDSHNITAVGTSDEALCRAVNAIIEAKGGIAVATDTEILLLALPIAGIMSDKDGETVATAYTNLDKAAKQLGSTLKAPFMTLSFMALLVIPELKLSDKGLFDGKKFVFTDLFLR